MNVGFRVSTARSTPYDEAGLDQLHSTGDMRRGIEEYNFGSIETPLGVFSLHVNYRLECDFSIEDPDQGVLDGRLTDMDENYFSPRSMGSARNMTSSPLAPHPRRDSTSSQRSVYDSDDLRRRSIGAGSMPRLNRHGSQLSVESSPANAVPGGGAGGPYQYSPVNIPAGSLPARMATGRTNSTSSNTSSPGGGGSGAPVPYTSTALGDSPAAPRSSISLQPSHREHRSSSWQSSPALNAAAPTFTPPTANFSLSRSAANGWRQEQPPFCTTAAPETQIAVTADGAALHSNAPFAAQTPPFEVLASPDRQALLLQPPSPSGPGGGNKASSALPLVRRASLTFATTGSAGSGGRDHGPYAGMSVFTPSSSAMGRPHLMGLEMPPLAIDSAASAAAAAHLGGNDPESKELGEFFKTLEVNRKRLEIAPRNGQEGPANSLQPLGGADHHHRYNYQQQHSSESHKHHNNNNNAHARAQSQSSAMTGSSNMGKVSRARLAIARFQELHEMNSSFSDSLSEMAASQHPDYDQPSAAHHQRRRRERRESSTSVLDDQQDQESRPNTGQSAAYEYYERPQGQNQYGVHARATTDLFSTSLPTNTPPHDLAEAAHETRSLAASRVGGPHGGDGGRRHRTELDAAYHDSRLGHGDYATPPTQQQQQQHPQHQQHDYYPIQQGGQQAQTEHEAEVDVNDEYRGHSTSSSSRRSSTGHRHHNQQQHHYHHHHHSSSTHHQNQNQQNRHHHHHHRRHDDTESIPEEQPGRAPLMSLPLRLNDQHQHSGGAGYRQRDDQHQRQNHSQQSRYNRHRDDSDRDHDDHDTLARGSLPISLSLAGERRTAAAGGGGGGAAAALGYDDEGDDYDDNGHLLMHQHPHSLAARHARQTRRRTASAGVHGGGGGASNGGPGSSGGRGRGGGGSGSAEGRYDGDEDELLFEMSGLDLLDGRTV
ncbi:hypothetical protein HDU86_007272 [Geranomyces michiganensis]|nr:hypothetical protein HDU86_007272 [Geranomyces michiganensis]